jgi:DNA-binding Lrp family transcriptional regulator
MNLYSCSIDLKDDAKALAFANAIDQWMTHLKTEGVIENWRLLRRKLNLASDCHRDFLLEVEVRDLAQLDQAFRMLGRHDDHVASLYRAVNMLVGEARFALYRPFPDPERSERMALI